MNGTILASNVTIDNVSTDADELLEISMASNVTSDHVSIDADELLEISMKKKLRYESPLPARCCIFRVPNVLRRCNKKAYEPDIVSIGPFHHGKTSLLAMENVKQWYLQDLLARVGPTLNISLKGLIGSIRQLEKHARECYAEPIDHLKEDELIEMMIVDGCFIIELLRKDRKGARFVEPDRDDPVFNMPCTIEYLYHDLLLLENQLPWSVLHCLFNQTQECEGRNLGLIELVFCFFGPLFSSRNPAEDEFNAGSIMFKTVHLLDLIRKMIIYDEAGEIGQIMKINDRAGHIGKITKRNDEAGHIGKRELIPCVTNLIGAGVKFRAALSNYVLDVKFSNGILEIPRLQVQESTEPIFRNLIAFEQCYHGCLEIVTSYAVLMDCLINTSKDVDFLCHEGILDNWLSAEDASQFFNRLYNDTDVTKFYYSGLCKEVSEYYRADWHKWRGILMRDYFNTPWATISVIAAFILLVLTLLQTIFSKT